MAYATTSDIQARSTRVYTADELAVAATLLDDAAVMIDAAAPNATETAKKVVSCRMVIRAIGDGENTYPVGTSQGSMGGLGYTQSFTVGSGGSVGELYLSKGDRMMLGCSNQIGSYSPVEELCYTD